MNYGSKGRIMAGKVKSKKKRVNEVAVVVFFLAGKEFGLEISQVKEIVKLKEITPVPKAPDFIEGAMNLRGRIISVMSICRRFNLEETAKTDRSRIIVAEAGDGNMGLVVDEMPEVVRIPENDMGAAPGILKTGVPPGFILGTAKSNGRSIILLDMGRILSREGTGRISPMSGKELTEK